MNVYALISFISTIFCMGTAMAVFHSNPRARVNRFFVISNLALAFTNFSEFMYRQAADIHQALFWNKINDASMAAVALFLCFVFVYTERDRLLKHPLVIIFVYLPLAVFTVLGLATDLIEGEPLKTASGYVSSGIPHPPLVFYLFNSWLLALALLAIILVLLFFRRATTSKQKIRARYFLIGLFPLVVVGTVEYMLAFFNITMPSTVSAAMVWMNLCIGFAIWKEALFAPDPAAAAEKIIDSVTDPLLLIDRLGTITRVNPAFQKLFGYGERDVIGRSFRFLFARDADQSGIPGLLASGQQLEQQEAELVKKTGEKIFALVSGGPVGNRLKSRQGSVLLVHDITRRRNDENELQRLAMDLERSNRELENFVSAASHDLKEPLRKIFIYGEKLLEADQDVLGRQEREQVRHMTESAERMRRLIEGLLDYSRIARGAATITSVDLNRVLAETLADLEILLRQSDGTVETCDLPVINADPLLMHQLFQNLIGNALKYRRPGVPPCVRIRTHREKEMLSIEISDNGIGFDAQYADQIFNIFTRLVGRNTYDGAGIGLAICRKIVEQHDGRISATGSPGEGSVFTVVLPLSTPPGRDILS